MWTRRDLLTLGIGACVFSKRSTSQAVVKKASTHRAKYFLTVVMGGGIDAVLTTDPKSRADVEPWVDIPYSQDDVSTLDSFTVGPVLRPLIQAHPHMAIVNGVNVGTANHPTGLFQMNRLKTAVNSHTPAIY